MLSQKNEAPPNLLSSQWATLISVGRIGTKTVSIVPETKLGFPLRASNVSEGHNPVQPQEGVLVQHIRHFFATESHWFGVE